MEDLAPPSVPSTDHQTVKLNNDNLTSADKTHALAVSPTDVLSERKRYNCAGPSDGPVESSEANTLWHRKEASDGIIMRHLGVVRVLPLLPYLI